MPASIKHLIADSGIVALTFKQELEPIDGADMPVFPPTYRAPEQGQHRFDTPYTVNETRDGTRICDLDSVQSQANRMEAAFSGELSDVVPRHVVQAEGHKVELTLLPHRIADASIRATELATSIREWMLDVSSGDPVPLAKVAPTSFVYGVWDSRDTQIRLPRAIRSEIRAHDISVFTRSAQFSGSFQREDLGLSETDWKKGTEIGFAPVTSVNAPGGILVHGEIVHSASILLNVLRKYRTVERNDLLPEYLLGLALGGLLVSTRNYELRSGCSLVPAAPPKCQTVYRTGERQSIDLDDRAIEDELRTAAGQWADFTGIQLGGEPQVHLYDPAAGKAMSKMKA